MIDKVQDVLGYLIIVRFISLLSKALIEPVLERKGYSENQIERIVVAMEVIEIAFVLMLLKERGD